MNVLRMCLRLNGVEVEEGASETSEECLEMAKEIFREMDDDVPDSVIDRVHRIGKPIENGKQFRRGIIRFTSWRHRIAVYKARKKAQKYRFRLDLTKKRIKVIGRTNDILCAIKIKGYTFADVNCRLCLKLEDGSHYFEDDNEFSDHVKK